VTQPPRSSLRDVILTGLMVIAVSCAVVVTYSVWQARNRGVTGDATIEVSRRRWSQLTARGQRIGKADAAVQVVEFTDFECPFCKQFHADYWPQLVSKYGANLSLRVHHYPLPAHPHAYSAARAVECAGAAGKFEEMFVALGQAEGALNDSVLAALQASIGVAEDHRFVDCWATTTNSSIEADRRLATDIGLTGTPTLIINGTRLRGLPSYVVIDSIVATKLAEVRQ